jgi:hypothetical protein
MFIKMNPDDANTQKQAILQAIDSFCGRIKKGRRSFIMLKTVEKIREEIKHEIKEEFKDATFRY